MSALVAAVVAYRIDQKEQPGIRWPDTALISLVCASWAIPVVFLLHDGCSCVEPPYWRVIIVSAVTGGAIGYRRLPSGNFQVRVLGFPPEVVADELAATLRVAELRFARREGHALPTPPGARFLTLGQAAGFLRLNTRTGSETSAPRRPRMSVASSGSSNRS